MSRRLFLFLLPVPTAILLSAATVGSTPPAAAPPPAKLWRRIEILMRDPRSIMPESRPYQPGSRTVDAYTVDRADAASRRTILRAGGILRVHRYPAGALLIKENFSRPGHETTVTAMLKLPGYDPADRNWVMAAYAPDGRVIAYGRVASCIGCHALVRGQDFVYAPPPAQLLPVAFIQAFFPGQKITAVYRKLLTEYPKNVVH
jgi:hypothetical protein